MLFSIDEHLETIPSIKPQSFQINFSVHNQIMSDILLNSIPDYLNRTFFTNVLKNGLNLRRDDDDIVTVERYRLNEATAKGDNYCSDIYRALIVYSVNNVPSEISLILKCMPETEFRGPILDDLQSYQKEKEMYFEVIPKFSRLLDGEMFCAK